MCAYMSSRRCAGLFGLNLVLTPCTVCTRNPHSTRDKIASSSTVLLSDLLSVFFPSFFFLYHTSANILQDFSMRGIDGTKTVPRVQ